jgi:hypothetical protein
MPMRRGDEVTTDVLQRPGRYQLGGRELASEGSGGG